MPGFSSGKCNQLLAALYLGVGEVYNVFHGYGSNGANSSNGGNTSNALTAHEAPIKVEWHLKKDYFRIFKNCFLLIYWSTSYPDPA